MLSEGTVYATVAVRDMAAAKEFYSNVLGLALVDENPGGVTYTSGNGKLFVYEAPTGGHNPATSVSWEVSDLEAVVEGLKAKGVVFEHYDMPGGEWQGDIAVWGPMKNAWFKDPDGNTLAVGSASAS